VQLLASGSILHQAMKAQPLLADRYDVAADIWSVPSFQLLRNEALEAERWNRLHPDAEARVPYVVQQLAGTDGPIVAATDYLKALPHMVAPWMDRPFTALGTDGFGRSDTRENLRRFFEIDAEHVAMAMLSELGRCGQIELDRVRSAPAELGIDPEAPFSLTH
jgi:pyruvate dehydrogenase E1 component